MIKFTQKRKKEQVGHIEAYLVHLHKLTSKKYAPLRITEEIKKFPSIHNKSSINTMICRKNILKRVYQKGKGGKMNLYKMNLYKWIETEKKPHELAPGLYDAAKKDKEKSNKTYIVRKATEIKQVLKNEKIKKKGHIISSVDLVKFQENLLRFLHYIHDQTTRGYKQMDLLHIMHDYNLILKSDVLNQMIRFRIVHGQLAEISGDPSSYMWTYPTAPDKELTDEIADAVLTPPRKRPPSESSKRPLTDIQTDGIEPTPHQQHKKGPGNAVEALQIAFTEMVGITKEMTDKINEIDRRTQTKIPPEETTPQMYREAILTLLGNTENREGDLTAPIDISFGIGFKVYEITISQVDQNRHPVLSTKD